VVAADCPSKAETRGTIAAYESTIDKRIFGGEDTIFATIVRPQSNQMSVQVVSATSAYRYSANTSEIPRKESERHLSISPDCISVRGNTSSASIP
jgi:hypothetical protein